MMESQNRAERRDSEDRTLAYRLLEKFGVSPASSVRQVWDASLEMTPEELSDPEMIEAWESLRNTRSRLLADFFWLDLPAEPPSVSRPCGQPLPPLPWSLLGRLPVLAAGADAGPAVLVKDEPDLPPMLFLPGSAESQAENNEEGK